MYTHTHTHMYTVSQYPVPKCLHLLLCIYEIGICQLFHHVNTSLLAKHPQRCRYKVLAQFVAKLN